VGNVTIVVGLALSFLDGIMTSGHAGC